jgi:hypothetical protein
MNYTKICLLLGLILPREVIKSNYFLLKIIIKLSLIKLSINLVFTLVIYLKII